MDPRTKPLPRWAQRYLDVEGASPYHAVIVNDATLGDTCRADILARYATGAHDKGFHDFAESQYADTCAVCRDMVRLV